MANFYIPNSNPEKIYPKFKEYEGGLGINCVVLKKLRKSNFCLYLHSLSLIINFPAQLEALFEG